MRDQPLNNIASFIIISLEARGNCTNQFIFTLASTASDALNWLETHGITMISGNDAQTFVSSQMESGQTLALTGRVFSNGYVTRIRHYLYVLPLQ